MSSAMLVLAVISGFVAACFLGAIACTGLVCGSAALTEKGWVGKKTTFATWLVGMIAGTATAFMMYRNPHLPLAWLALGLGSFVILVGASMGMDIGLRQRQKKQAAIAGKQRDAT